MVMGVQRGVLAGCLVVLCAGPLQAQQVNLTEGVPRKVLSLGGTPVVIERTQDTSATLPPDFARTARACPPFCIQPHAAAPGVDTLGELEVIGFLESHVAQGKGILIDARLPEWFQRGALPGAVNVPFTALDAANPYRDAILEALGGVPGAAGWDFSAAQDLTLYCNGAWSDQAPRAIRHLLAAGYPPDRLRYFRGGMQGWLMLGLGTQMPPDAN